MHASRQKGSFTQSCEPFFFLLENERQLEESIKKLMSSKSSMDVEERQQLISQFESNLQHGIQVAKGKLFVSNQAYDTVDKYIRRLDNDLNRFNISLARHKSEKGSNAERRDWKFRTGDMDLTSATGAGHASSMASRNRKANALLGTSTRGKTKNSGLTSDANTDDALFDEFPIDPNEPTYCLCNRVSFGEMVACDNDDVRGPSVFLAGGAYLSLCVCPPCFANRVAVAFL